MRTCESCENFKLGRCVEYGIEVATLDGCSNHIYSDDFYFSYRNKVWKAIEECNVDLLNELKECESDLYIEVTDELKAIQNTNFIKI